MNPPPTPRPRNQARQKVSGGFALVMTLLLISLLAVLITTFFASSRGDLEMADTYSKSIGVKQLSDSAVNMAIAQIREATLGFERDDSGAIAPGKPLAWASQPGMIRTFDQGGDAYQLYKLYSDETMQGDLLSLQADQTEVSTWSNWTNRAGEQRVDGPLWTDLNAPATRADGSRVYPIMAPPDTLDPESGIPIANGTQPGVEGYDLLASPGFSGATDQITPVDHPAPMPVKWLYVLENGEITTASASGAGGEEVDVNGASATNPIVGRIAFWTDDETSKLNLNTASEGLFWDPPRAEGGSMREMGKFQPTGREHQRHPGHPAMTSLSVVMPGLEARTRDVYELFPNYEFGGSLKAYEDLGSVHPMSLDHPVALDPIARHQRPAADGTHPSIIELDDDRLFASVDEFFFRAKRDNTSDDARTSIKPEILGLPDVDDEATMAKFMEASRFFLTTSSRAPETTLFNTPRISLWPIHVEGQQVIPGMPNYDESIDPQKVDPFDRVIGFCSVLNGNPYFFQRERPDHSTHDWNEIPRNPELMQYLQRLTSQDIPGYGGNFASKLGNADRDQVLVTMFDYIRSNPNLQNLGYFSDNNKLLNGYTNGGLYGNEAGQVWRIETPLGNGMGKSRFLSKFAITFACEEIEYEPASGSDPPKLTYTIRPVPMIETFSPSRQEGPERLMVKARITNVTGFDLSVNSEAWADDNGDGAGFDDPGGEEIFEVNGTIEGAIDSVAKSWASLENFMIPSAEPDPSYAMDTSKGKTFGAYLFLSEGKNADRGNEEVFDKIKPIRITFDVRPKPGTPPGDPPVYYGINELYKAATDTDDVVWSPTNSNPTYQERLATTELRIPGYYMSIGSGTVELEILNSADELLQKATLTFPHYGIEAMSQLDALGIGIPFMAERLARNSELNDLSLTAPFEERFTVNGTKYFNNNHRFGYGSMPGDVTIGASLVGDWRTSVVKSTLEADDFYYAPQNLSSWSDTRMQWHTLSSGYHNAEDWSPRGMVDKKRTFFDGNASKWDATSTYVASKTQNAGSGFVEPGEIARMTRVAGNPPGDWSNATGGSRGADGGLIGVPDNGSLGQFQSGSTFRSRNKYQPGMENRDSYFASWQTGDNPNGRMVVTDQDQFRMLYSPNRQMFSAFQFGSLPRGLDAHWETLLFCANPTAGNAHPGAANPPDHLLADLFWMPVVDPYPISEPFSTAGKVNLNYQLAPFNHVRRATALHGVFKATEIVAIDARKVVTRLPGKPEKALYKINVDDLRKANHGDDVNPEGVQQWQEADFFYPIHMNETLKGFEERFAQNEIFRSPTEIAEVLFYPQDQESDSPLVTYNGGNPADLFDWWNSGSLQDDRTLTGDNTREQPYASLHPRLTTKSNTYRIHYKVQTLKKAPGSDPSKWNENTDRVTSEYQGSALIERFIDPNDSTLPDFAELYTTDPADPNGVIDRFYRFRVLEAKRFAP